MAEAGVAVPSLLGNGSTSPATTIDGSTFDSATAGGVATPSDSGAFDFRSQITASSMLNSAHPLGPASKTWAIPPRKKPGRKPLKSLGNDDDGEERRRAQNREAQKNFRARRNGKETELSAELTETKKELSSCQAARNDDQRRFALELERERESIRRQYMMKVYSLEEELEKTRRLLQEAKANNPHQNDSTPTSQSQLATPTYESDMDMEMDMTNYGKSSDESRTLYGTSKHCGFCVDSTPCICKEVAMQSEATLPPTTSAEQSLKPEESSSMGAKTAPGGCEACLKDPEQAKRCRELAQYAQKSTSNREIMPKPEMASSKDRIACYDFVPRLPSIRDAIYQNAFSTMHTYPYSGSSSSFDPSNPNKLPAMEVDAAEAAKVLTSLANTPVPGPTSRPPRVEDDER